MSAPPNKLADIEFRPLKPHENIAFHKTEWRGFGDLFRPRPDEMAYGSKFLDVARTMCAFDSGSVVGTSGAFTARLPVPGGETIGMSAVTAVTVLATHRRRGVMTGMMKRLLEGEHELGMPTAGLLASESIIYGRFGYGVAVQEQAASIKTRHAAFRRPLNIEGKVRFAEATEVRSVGPDVWRKAMASRPGMVTRLDFEWDHEFRERVRGGNRFYIVYEESDEILGYAKYRLDQKPEMMPSGVQDQPGGFQLHVVELVGSTTDAIAALWRFLLDVDMTHTVSHWNEPMKSDLLWLLSDPRRLYLKPYDALWLRILDPIAALMGRTYSAPGTCTIELIDDICPWAGGTFRLESDGDGIAECRRSNANPDVTMPTAALATIYLGANHLFHLKQAGMVDEHKEGAVEALDALFATSHVHSFIHDF